MRRRGNEDRSRRQRLLRLEEGLRGSAGRGGIEVGVHGQMRRLRVVRIKNGYELGADSSDVLFLTSCLRAYAEMTPSFQRPIRIASKVCQR